MQYIATLNNHCKDKHVTHRSTNAKATQDSMLAHNGGHISVIEDIFLTLHLQLEWTWDLVVDRLVAVEELKRRFPWWGIVDHGVEGSGHRIISCWSRCCCFGCRVLWCRTEDSVWLLLDCWGNRYSTYRNSTNTYQQLYITYIIVQIIYNCTNYVQKYKLSANLLIIH